MRVIVFAKHEAYQISAGIHNGKRVEFIVPDDIVCFFERCGLGS